MEYSSSRKSIIYDIDLRFESEMQIWFSEMTISNSMNFEFNELKQSNELRFESIWFIWSRSVQLLPNLSFCNSSNSANIVNNIKIAWHIDHFFQVADLDLHYKGYIMEATNFVVQRKVSLHVDLE